MARVLNVGRNPAYPAAIRELKTDGTLPRRVRLRQCRYLNNVVEQDHRVVKKEGVAGQWVRFVSECMADVKGIKAMNMIRKGRVRGLLKGEAVGQALLIGELFGLVIGDNPSHHAFRLGASPSAS